MSHGLDGGGRKPPHPENETEPDIKVVARPIKIKRESSLTYAAICQFLSKLPPDERKIIILGLIGKFLR